MGSSSRLRPGFLFIGGVGNQKKRFWRGEMNVGFGTLFSSFNFLPLNQGISFVCQTRKLYFLKLKILSQSHFSLSNDASKHTVSDLKEAVKVDG